MHATGLCRMYVCHNVGPALRLHLQLRTLLDLGHTEPLHDYAPLSGLQRRDN
jgi:hypothetical protein